LTEPAVAEAGIYNVELGMVPCVEGFQTQLQTAAAGFDQREALEQRHVPVVAARSAQIVVSQSAPSAEGWSRECRRAKPLIDRMRSCECACQVWPVIAVYAVALLRSGEVDIDGQAGFRGDDAGDEQVLRPRVGPQIATCI
jgi:hypothetical protein